VATGRAGLGYNMVREIKLGDVVRLRKKHPCGANQWLVVRVGADIGFKCLECQRHLLLERSVFDCRVKAIIPSGGGEEP
jgi:hypothetical protein